MIKKIVSLLLVLCMIFSLAACTGSNQNTGPVNNTGNTNNSANANEAGNNAGANEGGNTNNVSGNTVDPADTQMQAEFASFIEKQYIYSIEESYSSAHVYYLDPAAAGLNDDNIEKSLGLAPDDEYYEETRSYYNDLKKELEGFDREKLTRRQQDEYDTVKWEIDSVLAMYDKKFEYYEQLFAPPNSLEANLVGLFSTWEIRNEKDIKDFVTLIDSIPAYVDSSLEYAKKQQEKKLFMTDFDAVETGCNDVINGGMKSFVINRLLDQVDEIEGLSDEKKASGRADLSAAFERSYLPSFVKIRDGINSLRGGYNNEEGLAAFPNGSEYFEALLNYYLGTYGKSGDDFLDELNSRYMSHITSLMGLYAKSQTAVDDYYNNEHNSGYKDYEGILESVKSKMLSDHPEVKDLKYQIELADAEEKLDEKNVAAYFVIPPLDGDHKQQMRVNPTNDDISSIDTYMTVTHEGFPGHMYQYAYLYDLDISDYLKTIGIDGMVEGYAMYSQYGALDYLDDPSVTDSDKLLAKIDSALMYLMYCEIDIGINYEGWSLEDTVKYFVEDGYDLEDEVVKEVYDFLRFSPGTYEPYGLGYEFIAGQRDRAEDELKDKFDAKEFNRAFMDASNGPRNVVSRYIDEYIESAK